MKALAESKYRRAGGSDTLPPTQIMCRSIAAVGVGVSGSREVLFSQYLRVARWLALSSIS